MNVRDVQQALKDAGFDPGPVDGVRGRLTIRAIRQFQAARGLTVDGIVGPITAEALLGGRAEEPPRAFEIPMTMPWLQEAHNLIGTAEVPGQGSNAAITGWAENLDIDYGDDDIPWCGLFVAHCVGSQLPDEPLVNNPLGARRWETFGTACDPQPGAVMVFWRGSRSGWKGHVGFYWGEDDSHYHVLGGNQGDAVTVRRFPRARFLAARWPVSCPAPAGGARLVLANGTPVTTGEA